MPGGRRLGEEEKRHGGRNAHPLGARGCRVEEHDLEGSGAPERTVDVGGERHRRDEGGGLDGAVLWSRGEVGELAAALRGGDRAATSAEFADVLAWLATIANVAEVNLERAVLEKYGSGCPGCGEMVCRCDGTAKP